LDFIDGDDVAQLGGATVCEVDEALFQNLDDMILDDDEDDDDEWKPDSDDEE
jgi:hypothetical protein